MADKYNLTKYEMETIINFNDDEATATLYTCNKAWMRKMDRLCEKQPETFTLIRQDECSKTYSFSKKLISIRTPKIYTEEQKEKMRQHGEQQKSNLERFHRINEGKRAIEMPE